MKNAANLMKCSAQGQPQCWQPEDLLAPTNLFRHRINFRLDRALLAKLQQKVPGCG